MHGGTRIYFTTDLEKKDDNDDGEPNGEHRFRKNLQTFVDLPKVSSNWPQPSPQN